VYLAGESVSDLSTSPAVAAPVLIVMLLGLVLGTISEMPGAECLRPNRLGLSIGGDG
jgi:hypothetical protein